MTSIRGVAGGVLALALGATAPSFSQPMPVAPASTTDPERLALAEKIYAMVGDQTVGAITRAMKTMLSASVGAQGGQDMARTQAIQAALSDGVDDMMPKVMRATAQIMAQDFSAEELRGMLAFYQSPTGQAVLRKMPEITQQSMRISMSLLPDFMRRFEADYCGRVVCTPQEQQAFAQINARLGQTAAGASR